MNFVFQQFARPHGLLGAAAGWIMANRPSNKMRNKWTVELLDPKPDDIVLEIGCGPGLGLSFATSCVRQGKLIAIDHSELMLRQAAVRNKIEISDGRLELRHGDLSTLPALNVEFDRVYSVNVALFWKDKHQALKAIRSVMRTNGVLATTFQPRKPRATRDDAINFAHEYSLLMQKSGFNAVKTRVLELKPVPAVCVLGKAS